MAQQNQLHPQFFLSQRNQNKLFFDGYIYVKDKAGKGNIVYWRCEDRHCPGRAKTDDNEILSSTPHPNHPRKDFNAEVQIAKASIRARAAESYEATSIVVSAETAHLSNQVKALLPSERALKQSVQRERKRMLPRLPQDLASIDLPYSSEQFKNLNAVRQVYSY